MSKYGYGCLPTEDEIRERWYQIASSVLTIGERYKEVEEVAIRITDACNKDMVGKQYTYSKERKAFFYINCGFSECYGYKKGFDLNKEIEDMISKHENESHTRAYCGGSSDRMQSFSCDNFIDLDIVIRYL